MIEERPEIVNPFAVDDKTHYRELTEYCRDNEWRLMAEKWKDWWWSVAANAAWYLRRI